MARGSDYTIGLPSTHQSKAYTGTAGTIDNGVGAQTYAVRVVVTTAAYVKVGDGTATSSDMYMPADTPEYFLIRPGETVSAIQVSSGGTVHVTEITH